MFSPYAPAVRPARCAPKLAAAATLLLAAGLAAPAAAQPVSWTGNVNSQWSTDGNWDEPGSPGFINTLIGNLPGVANGTVNLDVPAVVSALTIVNGMHLLTNDFQLGVSFNILVSEANLVSNGLGGSTLRRSRLRIDPRPGISLQVNHLNINDQGEVWIREGAHARVTDVLAITPSSRLRGAGLIEFTNVDTTLVNNGRIIAESDGSDILTFRQLAGGVFDLDGPSENAVLDLTLSDNADMTFEGPGLSDTFSGQIELVRGARLTMDLDSGWTADDAARINVDVSGFVEQSAQIRGTSLTLAGEIDVTGGWGNFHINTDALTFEPLAEVNIGPNSSMGVGLAVDTITVIEGGTYTYSPNTYLRFHGPTTVHGGTFNGSTDSYGSVDFFGATTWNGTVTINGTGRQLGDAVVAGPTVIDVEAFVMHGFNSAWAVNAPLVVNAGSISGGGVAGSFSGDMTIGGGLQGRLTLNLADPAASWTMDGAMTLTGIGGALPVTRLAGSPIVVTGALNISGGLAQVTADTALQDADVTIAAGSTLRVRGSTSVDAQTAFAGGGTMYNGVGGVMDLAGGVSLSQVGLANHNRLTIANTGAGTAAAASFTNTADGTWRVSVGGRPIDANHDRLNISGTASLNGTLEVEFIGPSAPHIGDVFTILSAVGGVSGAFPATAATNTGGQRYEWDVLHGANSVRVRLAHIIMVPEGCPADWNNDGVVNSSDISAFLTAWLTSLHAPSLAADVNADGAVNSSDISAFLTLWLAAVSDGCE